MGVWEGGTSSSTLLRTGLGWLASGVNSPLLSSSFFKSWSLASGSSMFYLFFSNSLHVVEEWQSRSFHFCSMYVCTYNNTYRIYKVTFFFRGCNFLF